MNPKTKSRLLIDHVTSLVLAGMLLGCEGLPVPAPADPEVEGVTAALRGPTPDAHALPDGPALAWIDLMLGLVSDERMGAPEAARLYGAVSVALYESVVGGMDDAASLGRQLNGLPRLKQAPAGLHLDWPTVMARATGLLAADLLADRPRAVAAVSALTEAQLEAREAAGVSEKVRGKSLDHGQRLGQDLIAWMRGDGFLANRDLPYSAPQGPDLWQPTGGAASGTRPSEPHFGRTRPFALPAAASCLPEPPPPYSEEPGSKLHTQAMTVHDTLYGLTEEQEGIARYWADGNGTPATPGHWMAIARQMVAGGTLARAVEVFVTVGVTQADAFISCWNTKYTYNHLRPETYIRRVIDPNWKPLLPTPQHPEHTSGHACSAGAAAEALTTLFGAGPFEDRTHAGRGLGTRPFASFSAAAREAAGSRLFTGHHFPTGSEAGLGEGRCVGRNFLGRVSLQERGSSCHQGR